MNRPFDGPDGTGAGCATLVFFAMVTCATVALLIIKAAR